MGNDNKTRIGTACHFIHQVTVALDIMVIKRGVNLIEHTDRGRIGQKNSKYQRQSRQRLLTAGKQAHALRLFAGRAGQDFKAGL